MPNHHSAEAHITSPAILDLEGIADRYEIGKTKATEVVNDPGFLNSLVEGMHRYLVAGLEILELHRSLAGTVADPSAVAPPSPPVVITRPAPGKPGPKPKSASNRKAA